MGDYHLGKVIGDKDQVDGGVGGEHHHKNLMIFPGMERAKK